MEQWVCQAIRLTALWPTPQDTSGLSTWKDVIGSVPDTREEQSRLGTVREIGPIWEDIAACVAEHRSSPGRVDWSISPTVYPDVQLAAFPNLGDLRSVADRFAQLIFKPAARHYAAPRLAIGLVALHHHTSKESSYAELTRLLRSSTIQLDGASDFSYQINRPRRSTVIEGMMVNRLSRWSSAALVGFHMDVSAPILAPGEVTNRTTTDQPLHATRVELDISSQVDWHDPIAESCRYPLLNELLSLALELPVSGDVP